MSQSITPPSLMNSQPTPATAEAMIALTDIQLDALAETLNLSLGEASRVFSQIVSDEIELSVPAVELVSGSALTERLASMEMSPNDRICGISQEFEDQHDFKTQTVLIFPERGSIEIVRRMVGDSSTVESITELEQDALTEIGNIIINSCMTTLSNLFNSELTGTLPRLIKVNSGSELVAEQDNHTHLLARIGMSLASENVTGYVLFIMDVKSIRSFVAKAEKIFGL